MLLFTGHKDHRLDSKDRVVIPSSFASILNAENDGRLYLVPSSDQPCIEAYPEAVFEQMAAGQIPNRFDGDQQTKRFFFQSAEKVQLRGPGRITIPQKFLKYFPARDVRVAGMNNYLELWHPVWWDRTVGAATQALPELPPAEPEGK